MNDENKMFSIFHKSTMEMRKEMGDAKLPDSPQKKKKISSRKRSKHHEAGLFDARINNGAHVMLIHFRMDATGGKLQVGDTVRLPIPGTTI